MRVATRPRPRSRASPGLAMSAACSPQVSWRSVGASVGRTVSPGTSSRAGARSTAGGVEGLREVLDQVVDVLDAWRDPDQAGRDPRGREARLVELRVGGAGGVRDAGLGVAQVREPRRELQGVEEGLAGLDTALELEVEHRPGAPREVLLRALVAGVVGQLGVDHARHALLLAEPLDEA